MNATQQSALANAGKSGEMVQSGFDVAQDVAGKSWNAETSQQYMNPYIEQALDPVIRRLNEESQQNAIGTRAGQISQGGVGAFGDARTGVLEGEIEESRLRGIGDTLATGYANAYESARTGFEQEQARRLQAGDLMGVQGGRYGATGAGQFAMGESAQANEQASLNVAYQDFLEQRDWNARGLNYYIQALSGTPSGGTSTTEAPGPSASQQAVGLGVTAAGLYNMFYS